MKYLLKWVLLSGCVAVMAGTASAGFLQSLEWVTAFREHHQWLIWLLPFGGLAVGALYHYWGKEVAPGNTLIFANIHLPGPIIPFRMAPFVYLGTMVTHFFGGSAGREGTALQMSGALSDQLSGRFKLGAGDRKILLTAALAAGFGSVFGTPLAGAVFSLEVVKTGRLRYEAIFPALCSAVLADQVTRLWHTSHTVYHIPFLPPFTWTNAALMAFAGLIFGRCAALFSSLLHRCSRLFKRHIAYAPLRPFAGGWIVVAAAALVGSRFTGLGVPVIVEAFDVTLPPTDFILKMAFTLVTLGAGFKGGEVTPLFFIGAALGSALSAIVPLPCALLAGMGFVAVFGGATNTFFACVVLAAELFGPSCAGYALVACGMAYMSSGAGGIYEMQRREPADGELLITTEETKIENL